MQSLEEIIQYITDGEVDYISWETILKLLCELQCYRDEKELRKQFREDDRWEG